MITQNENPIKESKYSINLGEGGLANISTEKLNGILKSIFVDIGEMQNLNIMVSLKDYPFVKILDASIKNSKCFYPASIETGVLGGEFEIPSRREYALNDELNIYLEGSINGIVNVVIRYE